MAKKNNNNQWSYELFSIRDELISVENFSRARFFTLYVNDELQGYFELPSKLPSSLKQSLIKSQARKSLKIYRQQKEIEDIYNEFLSILKEEKKKKPTKFEFPLIEPEELEELEEFEPTKKIPKKIPHEIVKEEKLEEIGIDYEERGDLNSLTIGYKDSYTFGTSFYDLFDMEKREEELISLTEKKIEEAITNFELKFPKKKITNFYFLIKTNKFSDDEDFKYISTGFLPKQKLILKEAVSSLIKNFNKDKTNKEKYGDMFKDEILSIAEMEVNILWNN